MPAINGIIKKLLNVIGSTILLKFKDILIMKTITNSKLWIIMSNCLLTLAIFEFLNWGANVEATE